MKESKRKCRDIEIPDNLLLEVHLLAEEHRKKAQVLLEVERVLRELIDAEIERREGY